MATRRCRYRSIDLTHERRRRRWWWWWWWWWWHCPNGVGIGVIAGFRHEVEEICARLCYYAACSCNSLRTFRDNLAVPFQSSRNPTRNTDRFPRKVEKILPLYATKYPIYNCCNPLERSVRSRLHSLSVVFRNPLLSISFLFLCRRQTRWWVGD